MNNHRSSRDYEQQYQDACGKAQGVLNRLLPFGVQLVVSGVSYGTGICLVQLVGNGLRISCANQLLGPCLGAVGVGAASALSGHMSRHVMRQFSSGKDLRQALSTPFWKDIDMTEALLDAVTGIVIFKVYGGSFRRLLPSDLRAPGAFAHQSVPLGKGEHANESQKGQLVSIFNRDGCHHCGSKRGEVIGDHIPPTKIVREMRDALTKLKSADSSMKQLPDFMRQIFMRDPSSLKQTYYAQCTGCCKAQAKLLRHDKGSALVTHCWLVAPGLTPGILVGFRQYFPALADKGGRATPPTGGSKRGSEKRQAKEEGQRHSIWSWVSPMLEEQQTGQDMYHNFQAKVLPEAPTFVAGPELFMAAQ